MSVLLIFFFFILGLEIKRELVVGELSDLKQASIVVIAAAGGVITPIVMYFLFNFNSHSFANGWAIPVATDTAIAIGIMSFFKSYLPKGVFPFVAALAVMDDIVAITIITVFYTQNLQIIYLGYASVLIGLMISANICGIRHGVFYALCGLLVWLFFEMSGVHGAIAGVIIALTIPARPKDTPHIFVKKMQSLLKRFEKKHDVEQHILKNDVQHEILQQVAQESLNATTPLKRWEGKFEWPVLLIILPFFALTNGAVSINLSIIYNALNTSLFWGILFGLVIGKPLGISLFSYIGIKFNIGKLPSDMKLKDVIAISVLAGIGYTMSIFVSELAFTSAAVTNIAKLSIVVSSLVAALVASLFIFKLRSIQQVNTLPDG